LQELFVESLMFLRCVGGVGNGAAAPQGATVLMTGGLFESNALSRSAVSANTKITRRLTRLNLGAGIV
jgi:hypothetical protein